MLAFPGMLKQAATQAGIKVPSDCDNFKSEEYPHFGVFCTVQLCRPVRHGEHWDNAKVIAALSDKEIREVTLADLISRGLEFRT